MRESRQRLLRAGLVIMRVLTLALTAPLGLLTGCEPSCAKTCTTLLSCDSVETNVTEIEECESSCLVQQEVYEDLGDDSAEREAFKELKQCIQSTECDAIAAGECYDEELYIW